MALYPCSIAVVVPAENQAKNSAAGFLRFKRKRENISEGRSVKRPTGELPALKNHHDSSSVRDRRGSIAGSARFQYPGSMFTLTMRGATRVSSLPDLSKTMPSN